MYDSVLLGMVSEIGSNDNFILCSIMYVVCEGDEWERNKRLDKSSRLKGTYITPHYSFYFSL